MTKWILPMACTIVLAACSSPGMMSGTSSGSGASGTAGTSGTSSPYGKHETPPGTYTAPGTANMPGGSTGTPGTSIDPRAPSGYGTGTSGLPQQPSGNR